MARPSYLARLLDVIDVAVTHERAPLPMSEIAAAAGVPVSTASRLLGLLGEHGFLVQLPDAGYAAGPRLLRVAMGAIERLRDTDRLKAAVEALSDQAGESASAGLLVGDEIVLVARKEPTHSLRAVARVGDIIAPHTSAMGKAILSRLPAQRRAAVLRAAVGEDADATLDRLEEELATATADGYAVDEGTFTVGLRCRAAPLLDGDGHAVGGLSIAGPAARFTPEHAESCLPALRAQVAALSPTPRSTA
ncbi:IclR family transcriptional regulator [Pseudonocardia acaciae]|uniref:IclR family transcriptional regulator n=1 Tax=Pseudonocardia acaciae TaxID=551276 RepID=UPI00048C6D37|nr:IclR family transcriptional regulator [Pseudonocardia acaciae]